MAKLVADIEAGKDVDCRARRGRERMGAMDPGRELFERRITEEQALEMAASEDPSIALRLRAAISGAEGE
jgi:hypothetical protein